MRECTVCCVVVQVAVAYRYLKHRLRAPFPSDAGQDDPNYNSTTWVARDLVVRQQQVADRIVGGIRADLDDKQALLNRLRRATVRCGWCIVHCYGCSVL